MRELKIEAKTENLSEVLAFVDGQLEAQGCPMKAQMQIDLVIEELFVNIARYAYAPGTGTAEIQMEVSKDASLVTITMIDRGRPYNPLAKHDPDIALSAEDRQIGGLGIYLVKKNVDEIGYLRRDGQNILTVTKKIRATG